MPIFGWLKNMEYCNKNEEFDCLWQQTNKKMIKVTFKFY